MIIKNGEYIAIDAVETDGITLSGTGRPNDPIKINIDYATRTELEDTKVEFNDKIIDFSASVDTNLKSKVNIDTYSADLTVINDNFNSIDEDIQNLFTSAEELRNDLIDEIEHRISADADLLSNIDTKVDISAFDEYQTTVDDRFTDITSAFNTKVNELSSSINTKVSNDIFTEFKNTIINSVETVSSTLSENIENLDNSIKTLDSAKLNVSAFDKFIIEDSEYKQSIADNIDFLSAGIDTKQEILIPGDHIKIENNVISLSGQLGKIYTGISPVNVDNELDTISVDTVDLNVKYPITLDNDTCTIGFDETIIPDAYTKVKTDELLALKQNEITDLDEIRNNASLGKTASDTIAEYGDIVSHNVNEFATYEQGQKADSAVQPTELDKYALNDDLNALSDKVDTKLNISSFAETSSSFQLKTEMTAYQLSGNYLSGNALDSLSGKWETVDNKLDSSAITSYYTKTEIDNKLSQSGSYLSANALDSLSGKWNEVSAKLDETAFNAYKVSAETEIAKKYDTSSMTAYYTSAQVEERLTNFGGFEVVTGDKSGKPIVENPSTKVIYLVKAESSKVDNYKEWIYTSANKWELIGDTTIDLTNYYTKAETSGKQEISAALAEKQDNLTNEQLSSISSVSSISSELKTNYYTTGQIDEKLNASGNYLSANALDSISANWNEVSAKLNKDEFNQFKTSAESELSKKFDTSAISDYYKKTETSGASEIAEALETKQDNLTDEQISAISSVSSILNDYPNKMYTSSFDEAIADYYTKTDVDNKISGINVEYDLTSETVTLSLEV